MSTSDAMGLERVGGWLEPLAVLPGWLRAAADTAAVHDTLRRAVRESGEETGEGTLLACTAARLRLKDVGWDVRYDATLRSVDGRDVPLHLTGHLTPPTLGASATEVSGRFSDSTWSCRLPSLGLDLHVEETDEALPVLEILLDPSRASELLERAVNRDRPASSVLRIERCAPRTTRYKPGSRCTVVYDVTAAWSDGRPAPAVVVAKTYHGQKGLIAYDGMRALWSSPLASSPAVRIAEPLGYLHDERVLVQGPLDEETTIKAVVEQAVAGSVPGSWEWLGRLAEHAADGLAELHACGAVPTGITRRDAELAESAGQRRLHVDAHLSRLATVVPVPTAAATRVLETIVKWAASCPPDPDVPTHGSFRPAQVLVSSDEISFIDFDGFCHAEPAMDIALFSASMKVTGMTVAASAGRSPTELASCMARLDEVGERFISRYAIRRPVNLERVALWESLELLTQLLHGWTKVNQARLDGTIPLLSTHLASSMPVSSSGHRKGLLTS